MTENKLHDLRKKLNDLKNKKSKLESEYKDEHKKLKDCYQTKIGSVEEEYSKLKRLYNYELNDIESTNIEMAENIIDIHVLCEDDYIKNKFDVHSASNFTEDIIDWILDTTDNSFDFNVQRIGLVRKLEFAPFEYEQDVSKKYISYDCTEPTDGHPLDLIYCGKGRYPHDKYVLLVELNENYRNKKWSLEEKAACVYYLEKIKKMNLSLIGSAYQQTNPVNESSGFSFGLKRLYRFVNDIFE